MKLGHTTTERTRHAVRSSITGWGHYLPDDTITNLDLASLVDTSDEWITSRTGIHARHRAGVAEATSDLAIVASRRALADARLDPADLDLVIMATATPDAPVPATASTVQHALRADHAGAMDLNAGCSGFLYGLHTADAFIRSGSAEHVLLIGAETLTRVTDYEDRRTCVLFGDGAGACVLAATGVFDVIYSGVGCDGSQRDLICIPAGGSRLPSSVKTIEDRQHYLQLDGGRVFRQAVRRMVEAAQEALDACGLTASDIAWVIPHQANERILSAVAEKLEIPIPKVIIDVADTGNTSAASVPIALDRARASGHFKPGQLILLVAFGAGLTWACQILRYAPHAEHHA